MLTRLWNNESPWVAAAAVAGVIALLIAMGVFYPSTKLGFLLVIVLAVVHRRMRGFAIDFAPFIVLLLTYNSLRAYADGLVGTEIHIVDLIRWERDLFGGQLPGHVLQTEIWGTPLHLPFDVLANFFYLSHFITPLILALALWNTNRSDYWAFMFALVVLSYAAFATYVLFPAAPPWWATKHGYLRSMPISLDSFVVSADVVASAPNPVAAMPSLHVAYPTFLALVSASVWGRRAWFVWLLPVGVCFSAVYLGHHYVIDGLVGALYATLVFSTVYWWLRRQQYSLDFLHNWLGTPTQQSSQEHGPQHG